MPDPLGNLSFTWPFYAAFGLGYLLGSVPFGLLLTRLMGLGDIRDIGSGNIGATNVLRTGRRGLAAATLALDIGKGAVAVLAAATLGPDMMVLAAAGVFLGHLFPPWLRFRGGKGVATFVGVMLAINPFLGLGTCLTWLAALGLFRRSSVGALIAALLAPYYAYVLVNPQIAELAALFLVLICWSHRANITRLIAGTEPKIGAG